MRNKTLPFIAKVFGFIAAAMVIHSSHAVQSITLTMPDCPGGTSLAFNAATNTLSCGGAPLVVNTPYNCTIAASPSTTPTAGVAAGAQVSLTASCTGKVAGCGRSLARRWIVS